MKGQSNCASYSLLITNSSTVEDNVICDSIIQDSHFLNSHCSSCLNYVHVLDKSIQQATMYSNPVSC